MRRIIMFELDICITMEEPYKKTIPVKAPLSLKMVSMMNQYNKPLIIAEVDNATPWVWHLFTSYLTPKTISMKRANFDFYYDIKDGAIYLGTMPENKRSKFTTHVYYLGLADPDLAASLDSEEDLQGKILK